MGIRPEEFWRMTPKELNLQFEGYLSAQERADYRAGIIAATIKNLFRSKGEKPFKPEDFIPRPKKKRSYKEQLAYVEFLNAIFGGKDLRGGGNG